MQHIRSSEDYRRQIVHTEFLPPRPAKFSELQTPLPEPLTRALNEMGIEQLYCHQAQAIDLLRQGKNVCIVTGTASGKTLCFNLPVLEKLLAQPQSKAFYLYPTKALAQDQLGKLLRFAELCPQLPLKAHTYDGDTPETTRRKVRQQANIVLTNPDMLHSGILPAHDRWAHFLADLKFIVIDELHVYRGVFGSHVANVIRRLKRICTHYGSSPQFVCTSATIANPKELAQKLTGVPMEVIDEDGSPRGPRFFVLWNPPLLDEAGLERRSANTDAYPLITELMRFGFPTIAFTRTRNATELIYRHTQDLLRTLAPRLAHLIRAYRSGYLPEERREIERKLFSGELMAVVATSALELGIDVGQLDACVLVGYPGTIASTWQRAGRAGRGEDEALIFLVAHNTPIDQYLVHHPDYFFGRSPEHAIVDPDNVHILLPHLRCAAMELALEDEELENFGEYAPALVALLCEHGQLRRAWQKWFWSGRGYPAADVSLRSISDVTYTIVDVGQSPPKAIGTIDEHSAYRQVHQEAIYLHDGETYFVTELDLTKKIAAVQKTDADYFTQAISDVRIRVNEAVHKKRWRVSDCFWGHVTVTDAVIMFRKIKLQTFETLGYGNLNLPPVEMETTAFWLIPPQSALNRLRQYDRNPAEGMLAIANVVTHVVPIYAMCDYSDIGCVMESENTGVPSLFVYDAHPGGLGFAQRAYELVEEILTSALELINSCPCEEGCPSCVGAPGWYAFPAYASGWDLIPDKEAAKVVLHDLLEREPYTPKPRTTKHQTRIKNHESAPPPTKPLPEKLEAEVRRQLFRMKKHR